MAEVARRLIGREGQLGPLTAALDGQELLDPASNSQAAELENAASDFVRQKKT